MELISMISNAFAHHGIWMWSIFAAQAVSIAIIAERVFALYIARQPGQKNLANAFEDEIRKGQIDKVLAKAQSLGAMNPLSKVIEAGAQAALDMGGRDEIQAKMDEVLIHENSKLERRTGFLAMLGNVGTLLGLLGTIVGMIHAFKAVANVSPVEKATILSNGISLAMHATAYGLLMAIPALVMYAVLSNRAQRLAEDLNQGALRVFNLLSYNYESIPAKKSRA
ncbi:MAG TPA: MotA/TolQ/ExbB proton channel family protein [Bdellovibrionales bacterium]|nr:MotA/TolQ/ExbB proton channel family protein [Bdellovibrionales bacterium]